jgi:hypothetical protein
MAETVRDPKEEAHEKGYVEGRRRTLINLLSHALKELRGFENPEDQPLIKLAVEVKEREETVAVLRRACEEFGDNGWPEDLHLGDVIENYLMKHIEKRRR